MHKRLTRPSRSYDNPHSVQDLQKVQISSWSLHTAEVALLPLHAGARPAYELLCLEMLVFVLGWRWSHRVAKSFSSPGEFVCGWCNSCPKWLINAPVKLIRFENFLHQVFKSDLISLTDYLESLSLPDFKKWYLRDIFVSSIFSDLLGRSFSSFHVFNSDYKNP